MQGADGQRRHEMRLADGAPTVVAADWQWLVTSRATGGCYAGADFFGDFGETDAADGGRCAREVAADDVRPEAERFEHLRGAITAQRGDAHLGHAFQQAFVDGGDIVFRRFRRVAVLRKSGDCFQRKIRMNGRGAVAEKQRVVHDFPHFAGFHDDADGRPQAGGGQCAVDGRDGQ